MTDRMMKSDSSAAPAAKPARAFRILTVLAAALFATAALSCTADSENTRGDVVRISVSGAASAAECVREALEHALLIVSYENGSEERIPLSPLPEGVVLSVGGTAVGFDRSFLQEDGEIVCLAVSYAGKTASLSVRNSAYQKPEPSDPEAPETPVYITDVSLFFAQEAYTEEQENILKELRVSVTFDGDGCSAHTKTLSLRELYDWLSDFYLYAGEYYRFSLYAGSGAEDELLFSFPSGNGFPENARIPLAAGETSFRWTLLLFAEPRKDYGGTVSVTVQEAGTYTLRLSDLESLAVPGAPDTPLTLTAQTIKLIGDISSGTLKVSYKEVENDAAASDANKKKAVETLVSQYDGAEVSVALLTSLIDKKISITKVENGKTLNRYIEINGNDSIDEGRLVAIQPDKGDVIHDNKTVPSYTISSPKIKVNLSGDFNYNEIHIEKGDNLNIDNARFTIGDKYLLSSDAVLDLYKNINSLFGKNVNYENIIKANTDSTNENDYVFPELDFRIFDREYDTNSGEQIDNKKSLNIASLFKLYTQVANNKIDKLNIKRLYNRRGTVAYNIDGRAYEKDNTTSLLFAEDGNTVKEDNVPNISIKTYFNLKQKYYSNISSVSNFKITNKDKYTSDEDINTTFRNVIFEDDMSGLTNSEKEQFKGVVYFMDLPYNNASAKTNIEGGILKLDKLEGVTSNTFRVTATEGILDLRGRYGLEQNPLKGYNINNESDKNIANDAEVDGIYFTKIGIENVKNLEDVENLENEENLKKIFRILTLRIKDTESVIRKIYVDNNKKDNIVRSLYPTIKSESLVGKKTPRSLEEFEYYGNNGRFEKSAYDSYKGNFEVLKEEEKNKLLQDKEGTLLDNLGKKNQIASNNNTAVYA